MLGEKLESSARMGAAFVPVDPQEKIVRQILAEKDPLGLPEAIRQVHESLQRIQRTNGLTSVVYTAIQSPVDPGSLVYVGTSGDDLELGLHFPMPPGALKAFSKRDTVFSDVFTNGKGSWIATYSPIFNREGQVIALLAMENPVSEEVQETTRELIFLILACLAAGIFASFVFGNVASRAIVDPIRAISRVAASVSNGDLSARCEVTGNDEISRLAQRFNEMVEEMRTSRQRLIKQAEDLEEAVQRRTLELKETQQTVQAMVDSVNEGFFLFDANGICRDVSSSNCVRMLEEKPNLKPIKDVLKVPEAESVSFDRWLKALFNQQLAFQDVAPLGPKQFRHSKGLQISLVYFPLYDEAKRLKSVVVVAGDRTEEVRNQQLAREKEKHANFILKAAQMGQALDNFFVNAEKDITKIRLEVADIQNSSLRISDLISLVHTLKGEASIFSLEDMSRLAHTLEDHLRDFEKTKSQKIELEIVDILGRLQEVMLENRMTFYEINIRSGGPDLAAIRDQRSKLVELIKIMSELSIPRELRIDLLKYGISQQIGWFFSVYSQFVQDLGAQLGKRMSRVELENSDLPIYAEPYQDLFRTMVHLIRNSLDHGIETSRERQDAGKSLEGTLRFKFERFPTTDRWFLRITMSDDGRGIDPVGIREKLRSLKGDYFTDTLSDDQVLQQIFDPGFSTKQQVSELSGRGVGLAAVKQECLNLGGDVTVKSVVGQGTTFIVEIPDSYDELINNSTRKAS